MVALTDDIDVGLVKSIYGSVETYKRLISNTPEKYNSQESIESAVYKEKIRLLNGTPSNSISSINDRLKPIVPDRRYFNSISDFRWTWENYVTFRNHLVLDTIRLRHNVKLFPHELCDINPNMFSIEIEYESFGKMKHVSIDNLPYRQFIEIYRDVHFMDMNPIACYCSPSGEKHIFTNRSLGELLMVDFKMLGITCDRDINSMLKSRGFNEQEFRKNLQDNTNSSIFRHN